MLAEQTFRRSIYNIVTSVLLTFIPNKTGYILYDMITCHKFRPSLLLTMMTLYRFGVMPLEKIYNMWKILDSSN